ncbi:MAG TPA: DMT family transporter [Gammaproteobacteria bacterium]|nr:DMT family transporter [Gammaproteobacteria bacterium]
MSWLLFSFSGPVMWALSTHIDKYLVERYFKHGRVAVLLIFTALIDIAVLPFIGYYRPDAAAPGHEHIPLIILAGVLYMGAMHFYLGALRNEEASVVGAYFQATPLFGGLLAYLFLGETLTTRQLGGGALIVAGAALVSFQFRKRHGRFKPQLLLLMLACTFTIAVSSVIFNIFAIKADFWTTAFWTYTGEILYGIGLLTIGSVRREFAASLRANTGAILSVNAINELINFGGTLGARYALLLAPLGMVQAIGSTTPLLVFLFGVLITLFLPKLGRENLAPANLLQKGVASLLVVGGVILVSIGV